MYYIFINYLIELRRIFEDYAKGTPTWSLDDWYKVKHSSVKTLGGMLNYHVFCTNFNKLTASRCLISSFASSLWFRVFAYFGLLGPQMGHLEV